MESTFFHSWSHCYGPGNHKIKYGLCTGFANSFFSCSQLCRCIYGRFETARTLWGACVEVFPASEHDVIICETGVHDTIMSVITVGRLVIHWVMDWLGFFPVMIFQSIWQVSYDWPPCNRGCSESGMAWNWLIVTNWGRTCTGFMGYVANAVKIETWVKDMTSVVHSQLPWFKSGSLIMEMAHLSYHKTIRCGIKSFIVSSSCFHLQGVLTRRLPDVNFDCKNV